MTPRNKHSRSWALALAALLLLLAAPAVAQTGGGYNLTWNTVDGGGGLSVDGGYELSGTVGQPEAGPVLSSGGYELTGGFWPGVSTTNRVYLPLVQR